MAESSSPDINFSIVGIVIGGEDRGVIINPKDSPIERLEFFESLTFPGITGNLVFKDDQGALELGNKAGALVTAGDEIMISFRAKEQSPITVKYTIYAIQEMPMTSAKAILSSVSFCSTWVYEAFTRKEPIKFCNDEEPFTISSIVSKIIKECGGETKNSTTPSIIKKTLDKQIERFLSPFWTPIQTIKYFMDFALSQDTYGGYVIWTNFKQPTPGKEIVNFAPISYFFGDEKENDDEGLPKGSSMCKGILRIGGENPDASQNDIKSFNPEKGVDDFKFANLGASNSKICGFDFDRTKRVEIDTGLLNYKHPHFGTKFPLIKKFNKTEYRSIKQTTLYPQTTYLIENEENVKDMLKGKLFTKYSLLFADFFVINVQLFGEMTDREVGKKIMLLVPSIDEHMKGKPNRKYSGTYIIRNIRHVMASGKYYHFATLISDGYKEIQDGAEDPDLTLMRWKT